MRRLRVDAPCQRVAILRATDIAQRLMLILMPDALLRYVTRDTLPLLRHARYGVAAAAGFSVRCHDAATATDADCHAAMMPDTPPLMLPRRTWLPDVIHDIAALILLAAFSPRYAPCLSMLLDAASADAYFARQRHAIILMLRCC